MKWTHAELVKLGYKVEFDEDIDIDRSEFEGNSLINGVTDVRVEGTGYLDDDEDRFYANLNISGIMLIPDAITGEEIEYPFETVTDEVYSFVDTAEDGVRIVTDDVIELLPAIVDAIILEVPLQVTVASSEDYPSGDGWRVISEEEYQKSQEEKIDPRLAKLKDFKTNEQ